MRILMLSHGYPPTISGVTLVVQKLSRAMVRRGHTVRVITASERRTPYRTIDQGVELIRIRGGRNPFWSEGPFPWVSRRELDDLITDFQPEIIHTHENVFLSTQLLRMRQRLKMPLVSSCYFLPRYVTHYIRLGPVRQALQQLIWTYIIRNLNSYDHVIFSTHSQEQDYLQHGLKVPTTVISNGVDTSRYMPANGHTDTIERRYQLPAGKRILFVGRLMPDKRIDLLVEAMNYIPAEVNAHLLVVGRGSEKQALQELANSSGLQDRVHLLGFIPEQDLPALYRRVDVFAIASICEVQSIPTLQALVSGLPVVGVNAAALPELIRDGVNGRLVPPDNPQLVAEALTSILTDADLRSRFGQASLDIGRAHAEQYTIQAYEAFYQGLLT